MNRENETNPKSYIRNFTLSEAEVPKSHILITGANGFVGSNLFDFLSADFQLTGVDISGPGKYAPANFFGWEDLDRLPPVSAIIHLAGKAHDTANISREEEYFEVNLGLTQKIFDYFLQSTAGKFIFFSSVKAAADTVRGEWLTEEDEPDPLTPYGRSKLEAERYILTKQQQYAAKSNHDPKDYNPYTVNPESQSPFDSPFAKGDKTRNLKQVYILRPAMIHGPGNKGNLNLLFNVVKKGIPWPLGAFENQRSFTSMDNLSFIIRQLLEKEIAPGIYQVADDETVSTNEIIRLISSSLGKKPGIWCLPAGMIRSIVKLGDLINFPLNNERLKKLTESYRVSNKKIKAALEIEKMPVSAKSGLLKTIDSFKIYESSKY